MLRKAIMCIFLLAYLSGIITIVLGNLFHYAADESPMADTFVDRVKALPWVNAQKNEQYYQIIHLYVIDNRIGNSLLRADWIKDFITDEEAQALTLLVILAEKDSAVPLSVSQSLWFRKGISANELALMEDLITITQENAHVAKNITASNWFFSNRTDTLKEIVSAVSCMPPDLALSLSCAPWFTSSSTVPPREFLECLDTLYRADAVLALRLSSLVKPQDVAWLYTINQLYATDKALVTTLFARTPLTRETVRCLYDLSFIAAVDKELAYTLVHTVTPDTMESISFLSSIISYPELRTLAYEFTTNTLVLCYLHNVVTVEVMETDLLKKGALFILDNPEFVYKDRTEPYRYHLLTHILSEIPQETAQKYKKLLFVTCAVYGNRFYAWQDEAYNTQNGWAYDKHLSDLEKKAVIDLITFFVENEHVVDVREESLEYLYGLVDIPFTHVVHLDGMVTETSYPEQGTRYVFSIVSNISTLQQRYHQLQKSVEKDCITYQNPLVTFILKEGEPRDVLFVYFCAKNWEYTSCINQTLQTRMDCIVTGISTTTMHWYAADKAHIYPAYKPTPLIAHTIKATPVTYGDPFVYKGFVAPYDKAGFKEYVDRSIESIEIYDAQLKKKVCLFYRPENRLLKKVPVLFGLGVLFVLIGGTVKIAKK